MIPHTSGHTDPPTGLEVSSPPVLEAVCPDPIAEYVEHPPCSDCNDTGDTEDGVCTCPAGSAAWAAFLGEKA